MKQKIITFIGLIFTVYGLVLCIMSNLNFGTVLVAVIGIIILCVGIFYQKIKELTSKGFFKFCKYLIVFGLCAELLFVSFLAIYGVNDNADYTEEAVIVLGAGIRGDKVTLPLKMRLDKAIEYHRKNPDALIVVTGGQGFQETVTEAYAMEKYLIENGVDKNIIVKEEKATSTAENMEFSKEILSDYFDDEYSVVVITNNFHIFRGVAIAKSAGFDEVLHMHAGLQWYNIIPCYLRESAAVAKMLILN